MTNETPHETSTLQRALAYIIGGLVILSLLAIVAIILGTWLGAGADQGSGKGIWPTVFFVPLLALPAAFILMMVLLIISMIARGKQNPDRRG